MKIRPEVWKDIKDFEGVYQISTWGRLKSYKRDPKGYILSVKDKNGNYLSVVLKHKGKRRSVKIHRLVAEAFIPNPDLKPEVNHKDTKKQNNHYQNLEWVDRLENVEHCLKHKRFFLLPMVRYNRFERPKPIYQFSLSGSFIAKYHNAGEASAYSGVCKRNILQVASKTEYKPGHYRKQAGGFKWSFQMEGRECG